MPTSRGNNQTINISESPRSSEQNFTQQVPVESIGPRGGTASGEDVAITTPAPVTVNKWKVMTTGDVGLKNAIYDFINTTKEGVRVTPNNINGREKRLVFNFYGTMGKSIKPGEIGEFEVVFSYPPAPAVPQNPTTEA